MIYKKILILGSGGREHALSINCSLSNPDKIYLAPGNGGTVDSSIVQNVAISPNNFSAIKDFALEKKVDCIIPGPELPIVEGINDYFEGSGIKVFGPNKYAAKLEGDKSFAKQFMQKHGIKTANYVVVEEYQSAIDCLSNFSYPVVIKASGLAGGKGVFVSPDLANAKHTITQLMKKEVLGKAGKKIVIEEHIKGFEISAIALVDKGVLVPLLYSQDHKRQLDNNKGPNTGGMGAYCPVPFITKELENKIYEDVLTKTNDGMNKDNLNYTGFLYAGLMIDEKNNCNVLEYNCRLGDPEAQALLTKLKTGMPEIIQQLDSGTMPTLNWYPGYALSVVMASESYPLVKEVPDRKQSIVLPEESENCFIYHGATKVENGELYSNGGRVLAVTAHAKTIVEARNIAYGTIAQIDFPRSQYRKDIGFQAINEGKIWL